MSNKEMLQEIISDEFFNSVISWIVKSTTYIKGSATVVASDPVDIEAIVQVASAKLLENNGLGIYTDRENFSVFTATEFDLSKGNYITFESKIYKVMKRLPWRSYGFGKYIMTQFNDEALNDN